MGKIETRRARRSRRSRRIQKSFRQMGGTPFISSIRTPWFRTMVDEHLRGIDVREMRHEGQNIFVIESAVAKKVLDKLDSAAMQEAGRRNMSYTDREELFAYMDALKNYVEEHTIYSPVTDKRYVVYSEWEKMFKRT